MRINKLEINCIKLYKLKLLIKCWPHKFYCQRKIAKSDKAFEGTNSNVKIHLLHHQPLNPRAVARNYEKIPGPHGMEFELKATTHIMGPM